MIRHVSFAYLCEGTSDAPLVSLIQDLFIEEGVLDAFGFMPELDRLIAPRNRSIAAKLEKLMELDGSFDVIVIHKDADDPNPHSSLQEIHEAATRTGFSNKYIALVPIQETEAWLLADESAIRVAAGFPNNTADLRLPPLRLIESTSSPKEVLLAALKRATPAGRYRERIEKSFADVRRDLLASLTPSGPNSRLSAFERLRTDIRTFVSREP